MDFCRSLIRSFGHALRGVGRTVREERNFRIHITAAVYVTVFAALYGVSPLQGAVLAGACGLVLGAELFNSALEAAVDFCSTRTDPLARKAKDAGAGAVLVCAAAALVTAVCLFREPDHWALALQRLRSFWPGIPALLAAGVLFICLGGKKKNIPAQEERTMTERDVEE